MLSEFATASDSLRRMAQRSSESGTKPDPRVTAAARTLVANELAALIRRRARTLARETDDAPEVAEAALNEVLIAELRRALPARILGAGDAAGPGARTAAYIRIGELVGLRRAGVISRLNQPVQGVPE